VKKWGCYCVIGGHAWRRAIRQLLKARRWREWSAGVPRREALEGRTRLKEEHEIFSKTRVYGARAGNTQVFFSYERC